MKRQRHKKSVVYLPVKKGMAGLLLFTAGVGTEYAYNESTREPTVIYSSSDISVEPCFTPSYKCQPLIIHEIEKAQQSIHVMAYSFSAEPIAQALAQAHQKGIEVLVILDRSQLGNRSKSTVLESVGIPIFIDNSVAIAHNKIMIFDNKKVITGSYNYSDVAEKRNAENLIIIDNPDVAQAYLKNWKNRYDKSIPKEMIVNHDKINP